MRKHAEWMSSTDERILEFLAENGNYQPSAMRDRLEELGGDLDYHSNWINKRCRKLESYGLLANVGGGVYSITDEGRAFLEGDLDASTLSSKS